MRGAAVLRVRRPPTEQLRKPKVWLSVRKQLLAQIGVQDLSCRRFGYLRVQSRARPESQPAMEHLGPAAGWTESNQPGKQSAPYRWVPRQTAAPTTRRELAE